MAQFVYQARSAGSGLSKGTLSAHDKSTAVEELRKRGLVVLSVKEKRVSALSTEIYIGNPVKNVDFIIYCRQFATLIRAGVNIVDATRILSEQSESKPLKKALVDVNSSILRGVSFSQSLVDHKRIFPPMFVNMVRAGEESGEIIWHNLVKLAW